MYDFAHPLEDAVENISHSICTLEFEDHRPLYDWCIENCDCVPPPRQYEFARLNLTQTIMSKRYLKKLVDEGVVDGWDDPRMPTICGLRRRGYTPESIRDFCDRIGVSKANSEVDAALLEHCVREDLNAKAKRIMAVLSPVKLVIENYPEGKTEMLEAENIPGDEIAGIRLVPFSREIYIEKEDFMEDPPKKFFRLTPGQEVRLKYAYIIQCENVVKDDKGEIIEIRCTYDPDSKSGGATAGRKVKGTLHWAEAHTAVRAEVRKFDYLLLPEDGEKKDFSARLNPASREVLSSALIEPEILKAGKGEQFQFLRQGYYCIDTKDTTDTKLAFNQIVGLKDSFAKSIVK
jgi:glutaminyl-tRNA synthetase